VRRPSTPLSLTLAVAIASAPLTIPNIAAAGAPAEAPAAEDPAFTEAKALYKQGEVKFQTADYEEALELWKRAFAILPDGDEYRGIRHALVYNIAEAHSKAYEISRNPTHLRKAKVLLENYRAAHRELYGDESDAVKERSEVDDRIAELDKKIADSQAAGEVAMPLNEDNAQAQAQPQQQGPQPIAQPSKPLTPQQQWEADVKADPTLGPDWEKGNKRLIGGAILTGIGGIFAIVSISSFVIGSSGNVFFPGVWYGTGGVTGALALGMIIPGGVLIGTGAAKRRQVLEAKPKPSARLAPMLTPTNYGVGFVGRF
jgi:tetratricopeptide (TPR) repeat protein